MTPRPRPRWRSSNRDNATQLKSLGQEAQENSLRRSAFYETRSCLLLTPDSGEADTAHRVKGKKVSWWVLRNAGAHSLLKKVPLCVHGGLRMTVEMPAAISALLPRLSPDPQASSAQTHLSIITEYTALGGISLPFTTFSGVSLSINTIRFESSITKANKAGLSRDSKIT